MTTIRFWTSHACKDPNQWMRWLELDPARFRLVHDPVDPDWLFGGEHIYLSSRRMHRFLSLLSPKRLSLYFAIEAVEPDLNLFDYAVIHDRDACNRDRIGRCPVFTFNNYLGHAYPDLSRGVDDPEAELSKKSRFCSFIYSNPNSHPRRDWLFHVLSRYKKVDSLGPHLHNADSPTSRFDRDWRRISIRLKSAYKFDIAAENARYAGYTTEKIMSSFMAHAVPIYWGNPLIAVEFNPDAFVNANGMEAEELVETVRKIDEDDELWFRMVSAPPMTAEQVNQAKLDLTVYRNWTSRVFSMPHEEARRRPDGSWASIYRNSFRSAGIRFLKNRNWTALPSKIRVRLAGAFSGRRPR